MRKRCVKATYCGAFWPLAQLLPCHGRLPTRVVCSRCIVNPYVPAFLGPRRFVKPSLKRQTNSLAKRGCASVNAPETTGGGAPTLSSPHFSTRLPHHVVLVPSSSDSDVSSRGLMVLYDCSALPVRGKRSHNSPGLGLSGSSSMQGLVKAAMPPHNWFRSLAFSCASGKLEHFNLGTKS